MLRVESIRVGYGDIVIISDLSIRINRGETVALIGGNGAGKTTILKAICGLQSLTKGSVVFMDRDITGMFTYQIAKLGLIMILSNARVFPKFSVRDNLLMGTLASGSDTRAFDKKLEEVHELFPILRDRARQRAETLSGGERQMLAMGRALMSEPKLLMMDEPTAGLAPKLAEEVFEFVRKMEHLGLTLLIVEEKVDKVLRVADRAYVLQNGRIVIEGTSTEVRQSAEMLRAYTGI